MGTLGRAIFTVGKWIRGTGQAMDRLGSTVQGGLRVEEQLSRHRTIMNIFEKEPRIHRDVFVAPSAAVIGDVEIGHGSSIWYGSILRGDVNSIHIGSGTNIQDNSLVHVAKTNIGGKVLPTIIGSNVTVGHSAILHACTIEDEAFVGMGATLLDRVVVEKHSMVGAGSLVKQNTRIPSGEGTTNAGAWGGRPKRPDMATLAGRRLLPRWVTTGGRRRLLGTAAEASPGGEEAGGGDAIYVKKPASAVTTRDETSVAMPVSFMTGSVVGKRFYRDATVRGADDGNGWTVMLDYRTLKSPAKRPLKLPSRALAMAIAAEWEYQDSDGIRPFTMPLMNLACTALERVPVTRAKVIDNLMKKFHQDLVFCRAPDDNELTIGVHQKQKKKIDPILDWVNTEFGFKPVVYTTFLGGRQEEGLAKAVETVLKKTTACELASIDAMAAAAHSLVIPLAIFRGRLGIEEAIELIRLEEDHQVDRWGLVEGGHDIDIADLKAQMSSAVVFLGLSRGM